ncbi:hypothetical protein [Pseudomonas aeruginosa]|uniref:hypothetical protein n=1 Tax=Pseudomonas aeruginosa TaxID=287 RepID=UPI0015BA0416|nr:hypothetical protein [Pseudomonas aeruginosa]EKW5974336.1 hypothetical protein [Pseudomonas aeruginosa]EMB5660461.1 hypothetical protein [Pseudomonas aeruginosa]MBX6202730.1 hypothetical protein [Pseudomonas aeruginosa]MBX6760767.1 hypothetical protein [Pseudomonas aeruginosa]MCT5895768.1 hypothetical protein [Pseudomonas aeruginosa]
MNWYTAHWQHMAKVRAQAIAEGLDATGIAKAIDQSIPCGRSGWAYKAWLSARRDFCRQHGLPLPRARQPGPDLLEGVR